jgi:NAD(P)-dependent dehydrogenase (short-subunit alcohol dehydrogenase family)
LARAEKLSQLAEEIAQEAKAQVFALRVDCADARSVREAFEGVLSLGPVEVLVYNACEPPAANGDDAAAARPTPFLAVTPDAFHRALAVSAGGAFHCAQQVRYGSTPHGRTLRE